MMKSETVPEANKTVSVLMELNDFANWYGYFYNAYLTPKDPADETFYAGRDPSPNNGYNCRHPESLQVDGTGCCYGWECPLCYEADEEDFVNFGGDPDDFEEGDFIVADIPEAEFNDSYMRKRGD